MHQQKQHNSYTISLQENNLIARMMRQSIKIRRLSRLIPCMYFTKIDLGLLGSGFLMYRYSAICFKTPIQQS